MKQRLAGNPNVRIINLASGYDTGELNTPARTKMLEARNARATSEGGGTKPGAKPGFRSQELGGVRPEQRVP